MLIILRILKMSRDLRIVKVYEKVVISRVFRYSCELPISFHLQIFSIHLHCQILFLNTLTAALFGNGVYYSRIRDFGRQSVNIASEKKFQEFVWYFF